MVILGVDPGLATVGFGVVDTNVGALRALDQGVIQTAAGTPLPERLAAIHAGIRELCQRHRVGEVAVEELFFAKNARMALQVGHARGVILLAAGETGLPVYEYTARQVKESLTGYGEAEKRQVQLLVQRTLSLAALPRPDDAADALAIAVCHAHARGARLRMEKAGVLVPGPGRRGGDPPTARRLKALIRRAAAG